MDTPPNHSLRSRLAGDPERTGIPERLAAGPPGWETYADVVVIGSGHRRPDRRAPGPRVLPGAARSWW